MTEKKQVTVTPKRPSSCDEEEEKVGLKTKAATCRRRIKFCGIIAAFLLIIVAIVVVILIFTVFKVKDPIIKLNGTTIDKLGLANNTTTMLRPGSNLSLIADVSVKNANYASIRYGNTTTTLFYHGLVIGDARGPPGLSKARRTMRMNVTVDIITDALISHPMLIKDMSAGLLPVTSYTRIGGKVTMLKVVKKHVVVKMNCTMAINATSLSIQDQKCKWKVKF